MVIVTMELRTTVSLVPVIVTGKLPDGVVELDVTVIVENPAPATDAGLKVAVAPGGSPLALNVTVPLKPPDGVTLDV
jgi:hypothetical protein